ncbi:MAG: flavodoxin domain-containing protein [Syntrophaceae bacterium]|nr:flavodoxin domain-containing protein [Syntrophaceae bacterium]
MYSAIKISNNVYWVGAVDWNIRDFHGYQTKRGSTYNAYLIMAEKPTLIDTVKAPFKEEMMARINSVIDPKDIEIIVSNHAEMDHTGCLPQVIDEIKPDGVYASTMGAKVLKEIFTLSQEIIPVKDEDSISLGNMNLTCLETKMLHWPDSMISYLEDDRLLFSQDGFGMHYASSERFDGNIPQDILEYEAATYYANILLPYSPLVAKLIQRVASTGLSIKIIAPDHGPVWRKNSQWIIQKYLEWAAQKPTAKAVIVYGTMWHNTEKMARSIAEGLSSKGVEVKFMCMDCHHRSDVMYELLTAGAVVIGSSTLNNNMLPQMADILTYMKGLKPKNLSGFAFGSYGWSGEAAVQIDAAMKEMGINMTDEPLRVKNAPAAAVLKECYERGQALADKILSVTG